MSGDISYGTEREVLSCAADWLSQGKTVALVTVTKTWGSSPRPPGSLMVMNTDGRFEGSVSGGCIESDLVRRFAEGELQPEQPMLIDYGVKAGDAARFGLPCGGRLELLVEQLDDAASLRSLLEQLENGNLVRRRVDLETGEVSLHSADIGEEFSAHTHAVNQLFGPSWQLLLIGAGQLASYTARMALMLGYAVTVCEPRASHREGWSEPGVTLVDDSPDEAVQALADHPRAVVITLAHDAKVDDMALMQALGSRCFYIGALGSTATSASRRQRLLKLDLSEAEIDRLHAPVGLDIGSRTPAEIALAIMAGITAERRKKVQS
ncbi:MAG: XdhC family protein [Gammaproteobacteria bacterium]